MASSVIEPIARVGFTARATVYVVLGALALGQATGQGGRTTDTKGAVEEVGRFTAGGLLLIVLALGLVAYAVWRIAQAVLDLDDKGRDPKGLAIRAGFFASALIHLGLAATAAGFGIASGSHSVRSWVGEALSHPGGVWAVGLAGGIVVAVGVFQIFSAWKANFEKNFMVSQMSSKVKSWARRIGQFGLGARGMTFLIIGWFLIRAAYNVSSREVKDVGGALRVLGSQPFGAWLLGIVACGLISYGLLSLVDARYRRIVR